MTIEVIALLVAIPAALLIGKAIEIFERWVLETPDDVHQRRSR